MSEPSGNAGPSKGSLPKVIPSLAKKQNDVTRLGVPKLKFVPTLPARRKKEEVKQEPTPTEVPPDAGRGRGRGRGGDRGRGRRRGRGGAEGRGAAPRPPQVEMTASGPFAMGPALAGSSARRTAPRSNFAPIVPQGPGLGTNLTQGAAPSLRGEKGKEKETGGAVKEEEEDEEEVYSDPDEGVEIVDMHNVRQMDWMAPEMLKKERETHKGRSKVKKEEHEKKIANGRGKSTAMDVDDASDNEEEKVNLANAVNLSESEEEEELEDIIDDFAFANDTEEDGDIRQERLYLFQFPSPFPVFFSKNPPAEEQDKGKGKEVEGAADGTKKVTFAEDTKPPAADDDAKTQEALKVDGVIGQLEVYASGAVKMRLANGILMDVTAATQPSFLQHAVYLDTEKKRLCVLGELNRRFIVSPDLEALLMSMELAEHPAEPEELDDLITMDTS